MGISFGFGSADCRASASIAGVGSPGLTVGIWVKIEAVGNANRTFWSCADTATATNYHCLRHNSSENVLIVTSDTTSGEDATAIATGPLIAQAWAYVLGRWSGTSWRAVHVLYHNVGYVAASSTASRNPGGFDTVTLGALVTTSTTQNFNGRVAEYFLAEGDIFGANNMTGLEPLVRKIAYEGPLAYADLQASLVEWRSLRRSSIDAGSNCEDIYIGPNNSSRGINVGATSPWANFITTVDILECDHPPLYPTYRKPTDTRRYMVV